MRYGAPVRVLGIDPGSRHTGYGVVESKGGRLKLLACGTLSPGEGLPIASRLAAIDRGLREVVTRLAPEAASVEEVYHAVNARSALVLGQARGVAMVAAASASIEVFEYSASEIKRAVSGSGRAGKEQVARMVAMLLGVEAPGDEHACDAIAAAICHLNRTRIPASSSGAKPIEALPAVKSATVSSGAPRRGTRGASAMQRARPAVIPPAPATAGRRQGRVGTKR